MLAPSNYEAISVIQQAGFTMTHQNEKHYSPSSGWYGLFKNHPRVEFHKDYRSIELSLEHVIEGTSIPKGEVTFTFGDRTIFYDQQMPDMDYVMRFLQDDYDPWAKEVKHANI